PRVRNLDGTLGQAATTDAVATIGREMEYAVVECPILATTQRHQRAAASVKHKPVEVVVILAGRRDAVGAAGALLIGGCTCKPNHAAAYRGEDSTQIVTSPCAGATHRAAEANG